VSDVTLICDICDEEVTGPEKGPGSIAFKMGSHKRWKHGIAGKGSHKKKPAVDAEREPIVTADDILDYPTPSEVYAERTPTDPKAEKKKDGGLLGKLWSNKDNPTSKGDAAPKTEERKPAAPKRRASTAGFWGDLVGPVSALSARAGYVPMARAMEWSSPVVGEIIEDATKGTLVDKGIQPFVRNSEKWQDLFDLVGFWGAIGMAQRNPAQAGPALDFARKRLVNLLPRIAKNIRAERAKERAAVEALVELMPDIRELFPDAGPDDDPVGLLIQSLFAAPEGEREFVDVP
jgi:hypothetical protein